MEQRIVPPPPPGFVPEKNIAPAPPPGFVIDSVSNETKQPQKTVKNPLWYDNLLGLIRPMLGGVQAGTSAGMKTLLKAADFISDKLGIPKSDAARKIAADLDIYSQENIKRGVGGIAGDVASGLGRAGVDIASIGLLGPAGLPVHGAIIGAGQGGIPGALTGAASGALAGGALRGMGGLNIPARVGASAAFGAATTPGGVGERVRGAATMGALGALGGKPRQGIVDMRTEPVGPKIKTVKPTAPKKTIDPVVAKLITAVKENKLLRKVQDIGYTKALAPKAAAASEAMEKTGGEAGLYAALGQLKGALPKIKTEGLRKALTQDDVDYLFNKASESPRLRDNFFDQLHAKEGLANLLEGGVPQPSQLKLLFEVYGKELPEEIMRQRPIWQKIKDNVIEATNVPRAMMSTMDLSFGGRQGIFVAASNPKEFFQGFARQFKLFGSERAYKAMQDQIVANKDYPLARAVKLGLTDKDNPFIEGREEAYRGGQMAEMIPVWGRVIRASDRAYTGYANNLRMALFTKWLDLSSKQTGIDARKNIKTAQNIAKLVNTQTGRGGLGALEKNVDLLNFGLFAPRLVASRLKILTSPLSFVRADKFTQRQQLKSLMGFLVAGTLVLRGAKMMGAKVGDDPRSADFGKIIVGKTRMDIWGGFQQYVRTAYQLISGETVNATTGKVTKVGKGYKPLTRWDIATRLVESKESPLLSLFTGAMKGKTTFGEPFKLGPELAKRFVPLYSSMITQDIIDMYKEDPGSILLTIPDIFGIGAQTYTKRKK